MSNKAAAILAGTAVLVGVLIGRASADTGGTAAPTKQVTGQALDPKAYPRTKEGAATAAAAYDDVIVRAGLMTPQQRREVVAEISTDAMRDQIAKSAEEGAQVAVKLFDLPKDQAQVVVRGAPLGYRVLSFTKDSARVEIWSTAVVGKPGVGHGITSQFTTTAFDVAWERSAWRLAGTPQSKDGPTPLADNSEASTQLLAAVKDLQEFSHVAR
ncbi:MAG: hypothetical protein ACRDYF_02165 [Acidimicrobiia bacterium]